MNLAIREIGGECLIVSQFTLYGDCRKGNRPGFDQAADPGTANRLYEYFVEKVRSEGIAGSSTQVLFKLKWVGSSGMTAGYFILESPGTKNETKEQ